MMEPFSVGAGLVALLAGTARGAYVEYTTYENSDCTNVISVSVYAGVPGQCVRVPSRRRCAVASNDGPEKRKESAGSCTASSIGSVVSG